MTNVDKILEWAIVGRRVDVVHVSHDVTYLCVKFLVKKNNKKNSTIWSLFDYSEK